MTSADRLSGGPGGRPPGLAPRRTCLTVPGSSERFLAKARLVAADEVILDLEDSVAPGVKQQAREFVSTALAVGWPRHQLLAVRVNGAISPWAYQDVIAVAEHSGGRLDAIVLPKVSAPAHVIWLDLLLGQIEQAAGLEPGRLAIEAQIEDAAGLAAVDQIATASPRLAALIFGPADFMASLGMRSLRIGAQPEDYAGGDAFHYPLMKILLAARAAGLQAIDGPYAAIGDIDGLTAASASVAALGFDGKWVVHPDQIEPVNGAFSPGQAEYDRAELILEAYEHATDVQGRGAVMLDGEMIDEASRKLALICAARGRAAGLIRSSAAS
jgi:citrate lyase subunit beta / citryl-CoA lyase